MIKKWWHNKTAYQIYPKSFLDSNGDGIGDLRGIISKLDYLKNLGIDIIWISPIYESPFVDQGYDISDYYAIASQFGTMEEFDELLREAKKRQMYIIMDLVINHCSDEHEWFQKAIKDPEGEYGDYFYFRKGQGDNPPSNYRSYFGGSAWEKVPDSEYYYLHFFAKEQPDLNWENVKVREALYQMVNWWLDKGIAGFRIDAIINIKKNTDFPDLSADGPDGLAHARRMIESVDGVGEMLEDLKNHTFAKYDAFTAAEVFNMKQDELEEFIGENGHFSTMFDFAAEELYTGECGWYDVKEPGFVKWRDTLLETQVKCQNIGFQANIIENHDEPRGAYRYLPDHAKNIQGIKMLGTISILLRGIPFIYQGQEIGMTNCRMASIDDYDDISTKNEYKVALDAGYTEKQALQMCYRYSRDNARTPMQWSGEPQAGFTTGTPWLMVNPNYTEVNVSRQESDPASVLQYYKSLLQLRKAPSYEDCLVYGITKPMFIQNQNLFAYERVGNGQTILVAANFGEKDEEIALDVKEILLSNSDIEMTKGAIVLKPCEVIVAEVYDN